MLQLTPILIAVASALVMYRISVWRTTRELGARSTRLVDPGLTHTFDRLAEALDIAQLPVNIYEIDPVNGMAAPDGQIYLTRGFYNRYRAGEITAEEMAGVIAHELGHVALGHSRRRMIDFGGQNAVRVVLASILGRFIPGVGILIANFLSGLLMARLSRQDEYEADAYAAALMSKAGFGTAPQISLLQKMDKLTGMAGRPPLWTASHPHTPDRIQAIEALEAKWHGNR
ncbi:M48 family metalloprotease [Amaricoccus tamworthensis]|uniref:M48 family metalloprotease n=1 Tax=Amaricoccus tamworthensis TaxID=57002 RepID=UPI003C7C4835